MTLKQISNAVGKPERTVHDWAKLASAKSAEISAKIAEARKTSKPADYDLAEACQIIEQGLGKAAADVYRTNAVLIEGIKRSDSVASAAKITALIRAVDKRLITPSQFREMIGAPADSMASATLAIEALKTTKPKASEKPIKIARVMTSLSEGEIRIAKACRMSGDGKFSPAEIGLGYQATAKYAKAANLPLKSRYTQEEGEQIVYEVWR